MYFAATNNLAIVGYNYRLVSFDSKKKRDMFVRNEPTFNAISAKELNYKFDNEIIDELRRYPESVLDLDGMLNGVVYFTTNGDYYGIEYIA